MPKKNAKSKRMDAERACEWYCHEVLGCVKTCRAVRTQWQSQDLFGCDVIGKKPTGHGVYIQATAGQYSAVTSRRRKLEVIPWLTHDQVQIVQLIQTEDPANARRKLWFFRVHEYVAHDFVQGIGPNVRVWKTSNNAVPVPREWFKAHKNRLK